MTPSWGRRVDRVLTAPVLAPLLRPLQRQVATIFMLHRFTDPVLGVVGHDERMVRRFVEFLRQRQFRICSALELVRAAARGEDVTRSVAFTVDDGYTDFDTVGGPLFRELGVPVTVFMPTGIVDRNDWCWWDRVAEAALAAPTGRYRLQLDGGPFELELTGSAERHAAAERLIHALKIMPRPRADEVIERLIEAVGVRLPDHPPPRLSLMTWDMIREQAAQGVQFGPHTVDHAILSRLDDAQAEFQISHSWSTLQEQVPDAAVPLFCYPNGETKDISPKHFPILERHGLEAAVTSEPRYVEGGTEPDSTLELYDIPRFALPDQIEVFKSIVLGVERLKTVARRSLASGEV
jgi:peptidoglycan/xylan/chitin deacetylase (PgdA/CDA1 family)